MAQIAKAYIPPKLNQAVDPNAGIDYERFNYVRMLDLSGPVSINDLRCPFIPDEIIVQCAFLGEIKDADEIKIPLPARVTLDGYVGGFQTSFGMQLLNIRSDTLFPNQPDVIQCNLVNTFNPRKTFSNMSRREYNGTVSHTIQGFILPGNEAIQDGGAILSMEFIRKRTTVDK